MQDPNELHRNEAIELHSFRAIRLYNPTEKIFFGAFEISTILKYIWYADSKNVIGLTVSALVLEIQPMLQRKVCDRHGLL